MNDLHKLANRLYKKANKVGEIGNDTAIIVGKTIVRELAFRTPVDTSAALSNWVVSLDKPSTTAISPHVPGSKGSTRGESALATISDAAAVLNGKKQGQNIYISNSLDYIPLLNDGSSSQAPAGFVEASIMVAEKLIRTAKVKKL